MKGQTTGAWWLSKWFVCLCISYFLVAGLFLLLLITFAGPSFGYYPCAVLFAVASFLWYRPRNGASFSLPLSLVSAYWFVDLQVWRWTNEGGTVAITTAVIALSFVPCLIIFAHEGIGWKPFSISTALVFVSFVVDSGFTNKLEVRTVKMSWSADGKTPWSDESHLDSQGHTPVILYAQVDGGYCYDAVFFEPLTQRLIQAGKSRVIVQYNEFKDFGAERGYNIRSVAGMQFNDGHRSLIEDSAGYGGTSLVPTPDGHKFVSPVCPR